MLGWLFSLAVGLFELGALIWALTTLAELKRGQERMLRKLAALEAAQLELSRSALPTEALLPRASE